MELTAEAKLTKLKWIICWVILIFLLSFPFWLTAETLELKDFNTTDIMQLLTALFIIALLVERSLEVFLSTFRGAKSRELDNEIGDLRKKINDVEEGEDKSSLEQELETKKKEKVSVSSETLKISLWAGLFLGLLVSGIGVRILRFLFNQTTFTSFTRLQLNLFNFLDVLVTGGLIAGGSDGIHKIMNLVRLVLEDRAEFIKNK